jgi:hypothetical protein
MPTPATTRLDEHPSNYARSRTLTVSPAAARHSYSEKRDFWDEHVYRPGLALLNEAQSQDEVVTSRYFENRAS